MAKKGNNYSFVNDITAFINKTRAKPDIILRALLLTGLKSVMIKNRVRTGRSRGNWRLSIGKPDLKAQYNVFDVSGNASLAKAETPPGLPTIFRDAGKENAAVADRAKFGTPAYLTNNIYYSDFLENRVGGSGDKHMYRTFLEMQAELVRIVNVINKHGAGARIP